MLDTLLVLNWGAFGLCAIFGQIAEALDDNNKKEWGLQFWIFFVSILIVLIVLLIFTIIYSIIILW